MTEPRADAAGWLLINGGIHLTSPCYSRHVFPLVLSPRLVTGLNIVRAQAGPAACLHQRPKRFVIQLTVPKDWERRLGPAARVTNAFGSIPRRSCLRPAIVNISIAFISCIESHRSINRRYDGQKRNQLSAGFRTLALRQKETPSGTLRSFVKRVDVRFARGMISVSKL